MPKFWLRFFATDLGEYPIDKRRTNEGKHKSTKQIAWIVNSQV